MKHRLPAGLILCVFLAGTAFGVEGNDPAPRPVLSGAEWERNPAPLLSNFGNMYQPCVVECPGAEHPYLMWFFGWAAEDCNPGFAGCDAIFHARSKDLQRWEVFSGDRGWDTEMRPETWVPVLVPGGAYYDTWHNGDPSVVFHEGRYYMAYSATSRDGFKNLPDHLGGMLLCVMGAVSDDGIHWTRAEQPLLIESEAAQKSDNDRDHAVDFHRPSLMREDGKWKLWFDYWCHPHGVCLGYAENAVEFGAPGGFQQAHDPRSPLIKTWTNPEVVKINGLYHCFADPPGHPPTDSANSEARMWSSRQICEAVSEDGLRWRVLGFIPPDPDVPANHVPQALVTGAEHPQLLLFYATQRGRRFPLKPGESYDYRYDQIRVMRRVIPLPERVPAPPRGLQ
ncbi:MAG: hypothetical protein GX580_00125 [Candidatus Hydrogenedens sp.]|nr:hypothetical protein [Candidatus Hydrogenedentota bacterium]NLF56025.1 hypothetical protein [Candidatus Hydrogenedens sp.]